LQSFEPEAYHPPIEQCLLFGDTKSKWDSVSLSFMRVKLTRTPALKAQGNKDWASLCGAFSAKFRIYHHRNWQSS
jgi:hypothetical protein